MGLPELFVDDGTLLKRQLVQTLPFPHLLDIVGVSSAMLWASSFHWTPHLPTGQVTFDIYTE